MLIQAQRKITTTTTNPRLEEVFQLNIKCNGFVGVSSKKRCCKTGVHPVQRTRRNCVRISSVGRKKFDYRAGSRLGSIPGAGPIPRVLKELNKCLSALAANGYNRPSRALG